MDGSESPGPSRRDLEPSETSQLFRSSSFHGYRSPRSPLVAYRSFARCGFWSNREYGRDQQPTTSRDDPGQVEDNDATDGMKAPPVTQEPKADDPPSRDELMSQSASEDDLDSDGQMVEGSPPVRREKRKRAVSDLSTESEGDLLDSPVTDLPVLPGASMLSNEHNKHRISLAKKGSLANRRKPTRSMAKQTQFTSLFESAAEAGSLLEEMVEEPARPPSRGSIGSPKSSPGMSRKPKDGALSLGMLIGKSPPPAVMAKPHMAGGIRMPVALPGLGAPAPKLRSVKKPPVPLPETKTEEPTPPWLTDAKLKKSTPKPDDIPSKAEKPAEKPKASWLGGKKLHKSPPKPDEKPEIRVTEESSPKWRTGLRRTASQRKDTESDKSDDDTPAWRPNLRRAASQKISSERMDSDGDSDSAPPWLGGLKRTPKKDAKDDIEPKRETSPVPAWMVEAKKTKKPAVLPPKDTEKSASPTLKERLKLKKRVPAVETDCDKTSTPRALDMNVGLEPTLKTSPVKLEQDLSPSSVSLEMDTGPSMVPPVKQTVDQGPVLSPPTKTTIEAGPVMAPPARPSAMIGGALDLQPPARFQMTSGPELSPPSQTKTEIGPDVSPSQVTKLESGPVIQPPSDKLRPLRNVKDDNGGNSSWTPPAESGAIPVPWMQETKVRRKKSIKDENNERVKADGDNGGKPSWMKEVLARRRKTQEKLYVRDKVALDNLAEMSNKEKDSPSQSPRQESRKSSLTKTVPLKVTDSSNISGPSSSLTESNKNVESQNKTNVSRSRQSSIGSSVGSDHELILTYIDNSDDTMKTPTKVFELDNATVRCSSSDLSPRDKDLSPRRGNYSNGSDSTGRVLMDENTPPQDSRRSSDTALYSTPFSRTQVLPPIKSPPGSQAEEKENTETVPSWRAEIAARKYARKLSLPRADEALKAVEIPLWKKELEERKKEKASSKPGPEEDTSSSSTMSSGQPLPPWKLELAQRKKKPPLSPKSIEPAQAQTQSESAAPEPDWMKQVSERRRQRLASFDAVTCMDEHQKGLLASLDKESC
ncbi:AF4/FMR2 family member 1-like isoform X9 [Lineus longissimus]|uniref:AF4/FMR2 family member 1-like isoform X9 n=1 Tax=Lineus longissimus TaxID=88925 RepID=UPI00315D6AA7